jgi:two-component system, NarL family, invasion response regulator UvrY
MSEQKTIKVALADDHVLLRDALALLVNSFNNCQVLFTATNGQEVINHIISGEFPDVIIMDLNMPLVDGHETTRWLQNNYPDIHVMMLTMYDSELTLIRMLQAGAKGFLKKDIHPEELKFAIQSVVESGYYYTNSVTGKLINLFRNTQDEKIVLRNMLSSQEAQFLKYCCSEMTYKVIAGEMGLSPRSVESVRDELFLRMGVKSRVGLAMYAIRHGLATF